MQRDERGGEAGVFADTLAELKRHGSLLLLTGVDGESRRAACQRLLGDAGAGPRKRLFVGIGTEPTPPGPSAAGDARRIRYRTPTRSAAAANAGTGPDVRTVGGGLPDLKRAIDEEVRAFAGAEPGTVRLCLREGDSLLAAHDEEAVFRFLHGLGGTARDAAAMAHVHLAAPADSDAVRTLVPLFDAVIETREGGQQRWHLREPELTTDWLSL